MKRLVTVHALRSVFPFLLVVFHSLVLLELKEGYHFGFLERLPRTGGVDFFFVLAGFMTAYAYRNKISRLRDAGKFLYNRFLRIYPFYWLLLFFVIIADYLLPSFGNEGDLYIGKIMQTVLLLPGESQPIISVAWSMSYTLLFYLLFGLSKLLPAAIKLTLAACWAVAIMLLSGLDHPAGNPAGFLFDGFHLELLAGGLLSAVLFRRQASHPAAYMVCGVALFGLTWCNYMLSWLELPPLLLYAAASLCMVYGAASLDWRRQVNVPVLLRKLGDASFAIYLTHSLLISSALSALNMIGIMNLQLNAVVMVAIFAFLCACVGLVLNHYVEKPLVSFLKAGKARGMISFLNIGKREVYNENSKT